jgi:hypothetical protein
MSLCISQTESFFAKKSAGTHSLTAGKNEIKIYLGIKN